MCVCLKGGGGCGVGEQVLKYPRDCASTPAMKGVGGGQWGGGAFDVAMELCSNEARYAAICPRQTRGGIAEWQPAR